jgi:hypothetical protein
MTAYSGGMDKRLAKRHKRQVERAREKKQVSEPDVRTHEEIQAAREASHADVSRANQPKLAASGRGFRNPATGTGSAAKTDG